jgi:hypothetical protein
MIRMEGSDSFDLLSLKLEQETLGLIGVGVKYA